MLRQWLQGLSQRERIILSAGVLATTLIMLFLLVWQPLDQRNKQLRQQVDTKIKLLNWMKETSVQVESLRKTIGNQYLTNSDTNLQQRVDHLAATVGIRIENRQDIEQNRVKLRFDETEFNHLLKLLDSTSKSGVSLYSISIKAAEKSGFVEANVALQLMGAE